MLDAIAKAPTKRDQIVLGAATCLLILLCIHSISVYFRHLPWATMFDFQSFYCGAWALVHHYDPYRNQPLHMCEAALNPSFFAVVRNVTIPAPLPPYALLILSPVLVLGWHLACIVWETGIFICAFGAAYFVSRIVKLPLYVSCVAMLPAIIFPSDVAGALAPYPIALWMIAAFYNERRPWLTSLALGISMIEPHLGLPVCIAAFFGWPAVRYRLLLIGGAMAIAQLLFTPTALIGSYRGLMEMHARSEVSGPAQHSLTFLLASLHVDPTLALRIGFVQYILTCAIGIVVGIVLSRRRGEPEWTLLVPLAFSVVGGPFVHLTEIAAAVPLCLLLVARLRSHIAALAAIILATPWYAVHAQLPFLPFVLLSTGVLIHAFWHPRLRIVILGAITAMIVLLSISPILSEPLGIAKSVVEGIPKIPAPPPYAYASTTWLAYNNLFLHDRWWLISRSPTWLGLVLMLTATGFALRLRSRTRAEESGKRGAVRGEQTTERTVLEPARP